MLAELIDAANPQNGELNLGRSIVASPFGIEHDVPADRVPRLVIAHALNVALFMDLLRRVPSGRIYVDTQTSANRQILLDHGAVRTVAWPSASTVLPGVEQVSRVLEPLGYSRRETYPLARLRMTGYSYAHIDNADEVSQWFVSEFHPDEFSPAFQSTVARVIGSSADPIDVTAAGHLDELTSEHSLTVKDALALMPILFSCFDRLHERPLESDYNRLVAESAEMAWIATEGAMFNHATDRVEDVAVEVAVAAAPSRLPIAVEG